MISQKIQNLILEKYGKDVICSTECGQCEGPEEWNRQQYRHHAFLYTD